MALFLSPFGYVLNAPAPVVQQRAASPAMVLGLSKLFNKADTKTMQGKVVPTGGAAPTTTPVFLRSSALTKEQQLDVLDRPDSVVFLNLEMNKILGAPTEAAPITESEVVELQAKWANAIKTISKTYKEEGDYIKAAGDAAGELYGYGHTDVLFKPTKATKHPFRPTGEVAMSYFVGADAMNMDEYKGEDAGFAINGGKGWSNVVFTNHQIDLNGPVAIAMGSYDFTDASSGDVVTVEYTFGYKRNEDGKPRIFLHHSSVPYKA